MATALRDTSFTAPARSLLAPYLSISKDHKPALLRPSQNNGMTKYVRRNLRDSAASPRYISQYSQSYQQQRCEYSKTLQTGLANVYSSDTEEITQRILKKRKMIWGKQNSKLN